ncbi:MAG: BamA/TamA family outer membrane protein [Gemmatimonadota bacterium]|nr:BamA/TamA family outer membrane protein [Gemmatimonadota bacterium]
MTAGQYVVAVSTPTDGRTARGSTWRHRAAIGALLLAALGSPAQSQELPVDSVVTDGVGISYWGLISPPTDSVRALMTRRPLAVWEAAVIWPYRIIALPFRLAADGVGETIEFVSETPSLSRLFAFRPRALRVTPDVSLGRLSGFGVGAALQHDSLFGGPTQARVRLSASTKRDRRADVGFRLPTATGIVTLGAGIRDHANTWFFGIGPDASEADSSLYREVQQWVGASYTQHVNGDVTLSANLLFSAARTDEPTVDVAPPLSQRFVGNLPVGFGSTSAGLSAGLTLRHDDTDGTGRPRTGGVRLARARYFHGTSADDTRFWSFRLEAQQFVPLWYRHNVLALRGFLTWIEPVGSVAIPFQRLITNNDPDLLRGFHDRRWRDRGLVGFTAEYRWPIWVATDPEGVGLDFYLLSDVGQVFADVADIRADDLTFSYGAGVRLLTVGGLALRIEYARGAERGVWRVQSHQVFQFAKGLFHGQDPAPER